MDDTVIFAELLECRRLWAAFAPAVRVAVDPSQSVVAADFTGDGRSDLVSSSFGGASLSVLQGDGDGGFSLLRELPMSPPPDFVTAADIDGNGRADLLAVSFAGNSVAVFSGNGDGSFSSPATFDAGNGPRACVVGDFNNDGRLDIALAKSFDKTLTLLLGNGNGTFQPPLNTPLSFTPTDLVAADFNGDGAVDLAATDFFARRLYVLTNNGHADFTAQSNITNAGPAAVTAADVNNDGKLDLFNADFDGDTLTLLPGNGDGTFGARKYIAAGDGATFVAAADLNGDDNVDLLVANSLADTVSVLPGNGNGTFAAAENYAVGTSPRSIVVADFNRDGRLDAAITCEDADSLSVLLSDTGGPRASIASARILSSGGGTGYTFTLTYNDNSGVDVSSLDDNDILVTGPNGYSRMATFVSFSGNTATYRAPAPGTFWKPGDNGTYTIALRANEVRDSQANPAAAATLGTFQAQITDAGNGVSEAQNLGAVQPGALRIAEDYVGTDDRNDFFELNVTAPTRAYLKLQNLADDADLQVLDADGNRIAYSKQSGESPEGLILDLSPGTYFARVLFTNGTDGTGFRLRIAAMNSDAGDEPGDNELEVARNVGTLASDSVRAFEGYTGLLDRNDFYRFELDAAASVYLKLYEMTDDADLQLLDAAGNRIGYSKSPGDLAEGIRLDLPPGTYFARVLFTNGLVQTDYRLRLAAT